MAVSTKVGVFWFVAPCSLVEVYRFRGPCCLHYQGEDSYLLYSSCIQNSYFTCCFIWM
jgi:hypothetical protein